MLSLCVYKLKGKSLKKEFIKKLNSERGVSILFGLFVFLVCAILGSVVLAAGTAAAGRISKMADTDRRYYSVMSAAELLKDTLDGQSVEIIRSKKTVTTDTDSYTKNESGGYDCNDTPETSEVTYMPPEVLYEKNPVTNGIALSVDMAIDMILGDYYAETTPSKEMWECSEYPVNNGTAEFCVVPDYGDGELKMNVEAKLASDKTLSLRISPAAVPTYAVRLVFEVGVEESIENSSSAPEKAITEPDADGNYTKTITTTEIEKKTDTVTLKFLHIENSF